jgi:PAS domain S-box-containing protein
MPPHKTLSPRRSQITGFVAFFVTAAVIASSGVWYYRAEVRNLTHEKYETLRAVGNLKASQIRQWRKNHESEIARAVRDSDVRRAVARTITNPQDRDSKIALRQSMQAEEEDPDHVGFLLFDPDANLLDASVGEHPVADGATVEAVRQAANDRRIVFSHFFRSPDGTVFLDLAAPVMDADGRMIAVLVMRHEADAYLYPLIRSWPTSSPSAETLLVGQCGDDAVFLNDVRHRPGAALSLRFPLANTNLPATQAIRGKRGVFEGVDYRGVPVVSDLQPVPESPWFIVSKMDRDEIYAEARFRAFSITLIAGLTILVTAGILAAFYRRRQAVIAGNLLASEAQRARDLERHRVVTHAAMDGFLLVNSEKRIVEVNDAYCRISGYPAEELLKMSIDDLHDAATTANIGRHIETLIAKGTDRFETRHRRRDGGLLDVEISAQHRPSDGLFVVFVRDITAKKAAEEKILRLTRFYAATSYCNQAIVHSEDAPTLFQKVCRVLVEHGGMKMAWVCMTDEATARVVHAASHGAGTAYLKDIEILLTPDSPLGRGPTGTSIREGRPVWCQDYENDPSTAPWRERAAPFGWKSSASIPLRLRGKPVGALTIYGGEVGAFDREVRNMLAEMADNISFAMDTYAHEDERKRVVAELQSLRTAVEQSADTIVITDTAGTIKYVNPAFEKSTGYSAAEALGKNPRVLNSGEQSPEFYRDLWRTVASGKTWRGQFHNRRKDGTLYWESATISPVFNEGGEIIQFIAVKDDITDRKAMEANLLELLDRAESANRAKSEFLAVMSHELRTPLNGVLGFADLLSETPLDPDQAEFTRTIKNSGEHLLQVVNDILDFSSIEKGSMRLASAPVPITELVESACATITKAASDKHIAFRCEIARGLPREIVGDARRIRQILINLLGNAVKFTSSGSVAVSVSSAAADQRNFLEFSVRDTGPGMDPATIALLFKPFSQADSTMSRRFEGTGLGLAISQRLAIAMGGIISVVSAPGEGSTFTLRLPLDQPAPAPEVRPTSEVRPAADAGCGRRVLVAEDDRVNSVLATKMLELLGYEVETASDGDRAVDAFAPGKFFAILMDMQMPRMDGIDATRVIRRREAGTGSRVRIIALTANVLPGDRERCIEAGMDDFLTKPFKKNDLAAALARAENAA